jgi:hypothetical protein
MRDYLADFLRIDLDAIVKLDAEIVRQCAETGRKKKELTYLLKVIQDG